MEHTCVSVPGSGSGHSWAGCFWFKALTRLQHCSGGQDLGTAGLGALVQGLHKVAALLKGSRSGHSWAGCSGSRSPQGYSIAQGVKIWAQLGWALLVQGPHRLQHCSVLVISRLSWGGGDPSLSSCTSGSLTVGGNTRSLTQGSATQRSSSCFL